MNTDSNQGNRANQRPAMAITGKTLEFPRMPRPNEAQDSRENGVSCNNGVCMVDWKPARPAA